MQVGIIGGTGAEGRGLAARLAAAGVNVLVGSRAIERARETVARLRDTRESLAIEPATTEQTITQSDIVCLSVPFAQAAAVLDAHRGKFRPGMLVIDVTVPIVFEGGAPQFVQVAEGSAAEHVRRLVPGEVRVAATFKTIPAALLGRVDVPLDCDEFVCGDSADARERATGLLRLIAGVRPIDVGGLDAARAIERLTWLAIRMNKQHGVRGARFRVVGL